LDTPVTTDGLGDFPRSFPRRTLDKTRLISRSFDWTVLPRWRKVFTAGATRLYFASPSAGCSLFHKNYTLFGNAWMYLMRRGKQAFGGRNSPAMVLRYQARGASVNDGLILDDRRSPSGPCRQ